MCALKVFLILILNHFLFFNLVFPKNANGKNVGRIFQVTVPLKRYKNTSACGATYYIAKYLKFDLNSHLLLDISLPIFLSNITSVAINHSIGEIFNIVFPVMDKAI